MDGGCGVAELKGEVGGLARFDGRGWSVDGDGGSGREGGEEGGELCIK